MPYTVTSDRTVQDELAVIWMQASDRDAVSRAANEIDRLLRLFPLTRGVAHDSFRTITVGPLTAVYRVSPDDRIVEILRFDYQG
jgi:hypothetical protein